MTSAMTTTLDHTPDRPHTMRLLAVGLALVLLLAVSFAIGHLTGSSHPAPVTSPARIQATTSAASGAGWTCQVGHLRGPC
jgi:hypothetical protein